MEFRFVAPDDPAITVLARLWAEAYPVKGVVDADGLARAANRARERARDEGTRVVAAQRDRDVLGAMILYDFTMNVRGRDARTSGLGSLAVSLAHKRQGVARAMVARMLGDAQERRTAFAALYPFRPDFYHRLGFGYGTPLYRFRFDPATLRDEGARGTARLLESDDADALLACDERVRLRFNGMIAARRGTVRRNLADPALRYVGIDDGAGALSAYMQTSVLLGGDRTANRNALLVRDLHYEDESALAALLGFLRAQRDQFTRIVVETQDQAFHLASRDPRDGSDLLVAPPAVHRIAETGLGIMYRLADVPRAFTHLGPVETPFALRIEVEDPFFAPTSGTWTFRFGRYAGPQRDDRALPDATLRIGIAELSSLVMGSLGLRALVRHRVATIEPEILLDRIDRAFIPDLRPVCTTRF